MEQKPYFDPQAAHNKNDIARGIENRHTEYYEKVLNINKDDVFLDMGCGYGIQAKKAALTCKKAVGVDFDADRVGKAIADCKMPNVSFRKIDIINPFDLGMRFTVIGLKDVLEHVPADKTVNVLKNAWYHLVPAGRVVIHKPSIHPPILSATSETAFVVTEELHLNDKRFAKVPPEHITFHSAISFILCMHKAGLAIQSFWMGTKAREGHDPGVDVVWNRNFVEWEIYAIGRKY